MLIPILALALAIDLAPAGARQPQLAAGSGLVAVAYGNGNSLSVAISKDQGKSFAAPVALPTKGVFSLGMHRGPRIVVAKDTLLVTAIAGVEGKGKDGDVLLWRSSDQGKTWTASAKPLNDVASAAREGLHAMDADAQGHVFVTWLDLRAKGTKLYATRSSDFGKTWSANVLLYDSPDASICTCCHPSVAFDSKGKLFVMFRNALGGQRDMYLMESADAGQTFGKAQRLGAQSWPLNACPMDGGAIALDPAQGKGLATAWRRDKEVFMSSSLTPDKEVRVGEGKNPALAINAKGPHAVWTSGKQLLYRPLSQTTPTVLAEDGAFPVLLTLPDGKIAAAWENAGGVKFQLLP